MKCPPASTLTAFASGGLRDDSLGDVEAHLASCPDCCAALAASTSAPEAGQVLAGRYRMLRELGHGAHGEVYLCEDLRLGRQVALKWLAPGEADPSSALRLLHEARILAALEHPHLSRVYDAEVFEGRPFLVSALAAKGSLLDSIDSGPLSWRDACERFAEAASGLHAAHQAGVVHCDVKPANLLLDGEGHTLVADFGLSTWTAVEPSALSLAQALSSRHRTGRAVGTPAYMAPEVADGGAPTPRSDQFSLGASLFQALTGTLPFAHASLEAWRAALDRGSPPLPPSVPRAVAKVVARTLHPKPAERFRDLDSVARALRAAIEAPRRRTRWLAVLGVGAATAVVVLGVGAARERRACAGAPEAWAATGLGEKLAALAPALPESSRAAFERRMAEVEQAWQSTWTRACEARGTTGQARWEQVSGCLETLAAGVATAAELASSRVSEDATLAFATLDEAVPTACTRAESNQPDWVRARKFSAEKETLFRINASRTLSDLSTGLAEARALRERGHSAHQPGLEALAAYLLGYLQIMAGDAKEALAAAESAELLAERAGDHRLRARSLSMQAFLHVTFLSNPAAAEPLVARALAIVERDGSHEQEGELLLTLGWLRTSQGRFDDAIAAFREAQAAAPEPGDHAWIQAKRSEARAFNQLKQHAQGAKHMREALAAAELRCGGPHPVVDMVRSDLGSTLVDVGAFTEARPVLERSLRASAVISPSNQAITETHLARIRFFLDDAQAAVRDHEALLRRAVERSMVKTLQAGLARRLVDEYSDQGRFAEAERLAHAMVASDVAKLGAANRDVGLDRCLWAQAASANHRPDAAAAIAFDTLDSALPPSPERGCAVLVRARAEGRLEPEPWLQVLSLTEGNDGWDTRLMRAEALARLGRRDEALALTEGLEGARVERLRHWLRGA